MVDYQALGRRMRMKRRSRSLTQEQVAKAARISGSYYGNIERGTRVPSIDTLVEIANYLNVGTDYLLFDSVKAANPNLSPQEMKALSRYLRAKLPELDYGDGMDDEALNDSRQTDDDLENDP